MNELWVFLASLFAGAAASMGIGGGAVLLLFLTVFAGVGQRTAQGINLIFFLPIAVVAVLIHAKSGLIRYKSAAICIVFGLLGVAGGLWLVQAISEEWLAKLFALLLLAMGLRELVSPKKPADGANNGHSSKHTGESGKGTGQSSTQPKRKNGTGKSQKPPRKKHGSSGDFHIRPHH